MNLGGLGNGIKVLLALMGFELMRTKLFRASDLSAKISLGGFCYLAVDAFIEPVEYSLNLPCGDEEREICLFPQEIIQWST